MNTKKEEIMRKTMVEDNLGEHLKYDQSEFTMNIDGIDFIFDPFKIGGGINWVIFDSRNGEKITTVTQNTDPYTVIERIEAMVEDAVCRCVICGEHDYLMKDTPDGWVCRQCVENGYSASKMRKSLDDKTKDYLELCYRTDPSFGERATALELLSLMDTDDKIFIANTIADDDYIYNMDEFNEEVNEICETKADAFWLGHNTPKGQFYSGDDYYTYDGYALPKSLTSLEADRKATDFILDNLDELGSQIDGYDEAMEMWSYAIHERDAGNPDYDYVASTRKSLSDGYFIKITYVNRETRPELFDGENGSTRNPLYATVFDDRNEAERVAEDIYHSNRGSISDAMVIDTQYRDISGRDYSYLFDDYDASTRKSIAWKGGDDTDNGSYFINDGIEYRVWYDGWNYVASISYSDGTVIAQEEFDRTDLNEAKRWLEQQARSGLH